MVLVYLKTVKSTEKWLYHAIKLENFVIKEVLIATNRLLLSLFP